MKKLIILLFLAISLIGFSQNYDKNLMWAYQHDSLYGITYDGHEFPDIKSDRDLRLYNQMLETNRLWQVEADEWRREQDSINHWKAWAEYCEYPTMYRIGDNLYIRNRNNNTIFRYNSETQKFDKMAKPLETKYVDSGLLAINKAISIPANSNIETQFCNDKLIVNTETAVSSCIDFSLVKFPGGIGSLVYDSNRKLYFEIQVLETRHTETKELIVPVTYACSFTCSNSEAEKLYKQIKAAYKLYLNQNL